MVNPGIELALHPKQLVRKTYPSKLNGIFIYLLPMISVPGKEIFFGQLKLIKGGLGEDYEAKIV